ncbi:MAG TPA: hypothetical protein VK588_04720, partial [Chitinophagaceae bacterium]|nr:hypothetical protein [Chitinophagaceae bacterium]
CDADCNRIGTDTHTMGLAFGFNEGWAEFWEGSIGGCSNNDDECEGNVAHALFNLSKLPGSGKKVMVNVLKDHPGAIHSLDEFAGFLQAAISIQTLSLTQMISTDRDLALTEKVHPFAPLKESYILAEIKKEMSATKLQIDSLNNALIAARRVSAIMPSCHDSDCYNTFQILIRPALISAELKLKKASMQRLQQSIETRDREKTLIQMNNGSWEKQMEKQRIKWNADIVQINLSAFQEAIQSVNKHLNNSKQMLLLSKDLQRKYQRLQGQVKERKPLDLNANSQPQIGENIPVHKSVR